MELKILASFLLLGSTLVLAEQIKYTGYKVLRIVPRNEAEVNILRELENLGLDFWSGPNPPNQNSDVMVPPHMLENIDLIRASGMEVSEFILDVQSVIDQTSSDVVMRRAPGQNFQFDVYHRYDDIIAWLKEQASAHPEIASTFSIGKSFEGRDLQILKISKPSSKSKRAIWIDASIHAREWITGAVALYVINELLNGNNPTYQKWVDDYDWYFLPVHNPDGFEFSHTNNRLWRKTRSDTRSPIGCKGADPNRNWNFQWMTGGASTAPCMDTFGGYEAFSEPETNLTAQYISTIVKDIDVFLSLHSYSQLLLIPYGVRTPKFPHHELHMDIGKRVAKAIESRFGTKFTVGNIVDLLYVASGGSMDWVQGVHGVPISFTFELRDKGRFGFVLPKEQIVPSSLEFLDGLTVLVDAARNLPKNN